MRKVSLTVRKYNTNLHSYKRGDLCFRMHKRQIGRNLQCLGTTHGKSIKQMGLDLIIQIMNCYKRSLRVSGEALFNDVEKRLFEGSTCLRTALPRAGVVEVEIPALIVLLVRGPAPVVVAIDREWRRYTCCNHFCSPKLSPVSAANSLPCCHTRRWSP